MATRSIATTNTIGFQSISFIRPQVVRWTVTNTKPGTRLYAFFDGKPVDQYVTPDGTYTGAPIITNSAGEISGNFYIPPATFNTGERIFRLQDSSNFDDQFVPGATMGSASAPFTAIGYLQTLQTTVDNITTIENNILDPAPPPPPPVFQFGNDREGHGGGGQDPLAESFFTYGVKGGCFVTKVEIYFQSKDANLPVTLELRRLVNGYPSRQRVNQFSSVSLKPANVNISNNSSVATAFVFSRPIYLEEDAEYAIVLISSSDKYNVWTAEMAAKSIETGKTIFSQPFNGSLFRSENDTTWNAYQTEDMKFTIYRAQFSTDAPVNVTMKTTSAPCLVNGDNITAVSGSSVLTVKLPFQHAQKTGDIVVWEGIAAGVYRGIPSAAISNTNGFAITRIDDYSFTFNCGTTATSSGTLAASGIVNAVVIDEGGAGYTAPTITITGGGATTNATATLQVTAGVITGATITDPGVGYTSKPTFVIADSVGSSGNGVKADVISEAIFVTNINRKFQAVTPIISQQLPPGTKTEATLKTTDINYNTGAHAPIPLNNYTQLTKNAVVVNPKVEASTFAANPSTQMILTLSSDNPNVSPLIDLGQNPRLRLNNFLINDDTTTVLASETLPGASTGLAESRYISKPVTLETISTGIKIIVSASSVKNTSYAVYVKTSLNNNEGAHEDQPWQLLTCDTLTNLSDTKDEFIDYNWHKDNIPNFDVYSIKIVLYSPNQYEFPIIDNYRSIILST